MLLNRETYTRLHKAIQRSTIKALETLHGECIAVDDETGEEWSHKWRNGETRIYIEPDEDEGPSQNIVEESVECIFAIRVELVAVETE
jgi:predicted ATP-dependent Lon-type protease